MVKAERVPLNEYEWRKRDNDCMRDKREKRYVEADRHIWSEAWYISIG